MDRVQSYDIPIATTTTATTAFYVDKYDQLMLYVPNVVGTFSSSPVQITLKGKPSTAHSSLQMNYFDYVNKTPAICAITITTGGVYEMPYPGATNYVAFQFDVATSNTTSITLMAPKTTY